MTKLFFNFFLPALNERRDKKKKKEAWVRGEGREMKTQTRAVMKNSRIKKK